MNCVVTILQNKRVAMPYYFHQYSLPMMNNEMPNADISLFHIFHSTHVKESAMRSNKMDEKHINKVQQYIDATFYSNAKIIPHNVVNKKYPSLPSIRLALEVALEEKADIHVWMEDDALIYDKDCGSWCTSLGSGDAGLYTDTDAKQMINTAYFISTREFDLRFLNIVDEIMTVTSVPKSVKGKWDDYAGKGSLLEHCAWRATRQPIFLGPDKCYRHHPHPTQYKKTKAMVSEWLLKQIPNIKDDLHWLDEDFTE